MRITHQIDFARRVVVLTASGELTDEGILDIHDELMKDPDVRPDFALLIDLREAIGRDLTTAAVRSLAERFLVFSPESRRAVVVQSDFGFGMARMYESLRGEKGGGMSVFRDIDEALLWVRTGDR